MCAAFKILLVEDNPGDVRLFREALASRQVAFELMVADDGQKAIAVLADLRRALPSEAPFDLIVLDINLPKHRGDEVLRHIRAEPSLTEVPVIVLTSSTAPTDRAAATGLGADRYIRKPTDLDQLMEMATQVEEILRRTGSGARNPGK